MVRVLGRVLNRRGMEWYERMGLALPESLGFRRNMGCDDVQFAIRRLDEEVRAWETG